jgi:phytoene/squalene synthetase
LAPEERAAYLAAEARKSDPDRYLCALLAPTDRRAAVMAMILLDHELARVPELVSQPVAGLIRYQWWREAIDEASAGRPRQQPVVEELAAAISRDWVAASALQQLIDAREPLLDGTTGTTPAAVEAFARTTAGALQGLIYRSLGGKAEREADAAVTIGTGTGLLGVARALAREAAEREQRVEVEGASRELVARAADLLRGGRAAAGRPARRQMAAFLPAVLAEARLRHWPQRAERLPALAPLVLVARAMLRRP